MQWLVAQTTEAKPRPRPAAGVFQFTEKCALAEGWVYPPRGQSKRGTVGQFRRRGASATLTQQFVCKIAPDIRATSLPRAAPSACRGMAAV